MLTRTTPHHEAARGEGRHTRSTAGAGAAVRPEARTRAAGGPQDHAYYACPCGFVFAGAVSTHVACPHCGADQVW